jgi:hypothetical protein
VNDNYQAIYDAVRSRIGSCDVGNVIRDACQLDASHAIYMTGIAWQEAAWAAASPSAIYRPRIAIDGNQWCALYGDNIQEGVAGFGDSPAAAMADFDRNWLTSLAAAQQPSPRESDMAEKMTLTEVRDAMSVKLESFFPARDDEVKSWMDAIAAHIAQHADLEESNKLLRSAAQKNVLATAGLRQQHAELIAQLTFDVRVEQGLREFAEKKHAEMARDVARYRWLRKRLEVTRNGAVPDCISMEHWRVEDSKSPDDATYVDETIDAAMTGESHD